MKGRLLPGRQPSRNIRSTDPPTGPGKLDTVGRRQVDGGLVKRSQDGLSADPIVF